MPSLRDKLRATAKSPNRPAERIKPAPQDCYVREMHFPLPDMRLSLPEGILPLMQGDSSLPCAVDPERFLFLDTETTGLSRGAGTVAFLVGVGYIRGREMIVRQYLMRDYDEEIFVLRHVLEHFERIQALVTFNGRAFDLPLLQSRLIMQRIRADVCSLPHVDLLHTARRVWKLRLSSCRLSALEEHIYGEPRMDDLPGAEVPQRYFDYLKSHNFSLLEDILKHNAQDIVTLLRLLYTLADLHENPMSAEFVQDIFSLGRVYEKRGRIQTARACYRAADAGSMSALSRERLAYCLNREHEPQEAARIYEKMIAAHQGGAKPYIALCKILEHKLKDIQKAADVARKGLMYLTDLPQNDPLQAQAFEDLTKRYARLLLKLRNAAEKQQVIDK